MTDVTEQVHELTIDELARETGMTVRNIRAHQSRGLLPPPEVRARTGYYGPDHAARLTLIKELQGLRGTDEKFEAKAVVLKESVEHHADEEEDDLFPAVEKEMDDDQLRELGRQMKAMETRLTSGAKPARGAKTGRQAPSRA